MPHGCSTILRASTTDYFSSLQAIEPLQKPSTASKRSARYNKFRIVPPLASAYRPLSGSGTTRNKKSLRPKQEPVSPVMSGYGVSLYERSRLRYITYNHYSIPRLAKGIIIMLLLHTNRQYRNIPRHRSISIMHNIRSIHRNHTKSFRITTPSQLNLSLLGTSKQRPEHPTKGNGMDTANILMCL